jgi:hypothetical protein
MDHAMTIGAKNSKVRTDLIGNRLTLVQRSKGFEMVSLDKAFANRSIDFLEPEVACLTPHAVMFLGCIPCLWISLDPAMHPVTALLDKGCGIGRAVFVGFLHNGIEATAKHERFISNDRCAKISNKHVVGRKVGKGVA